MKLYQDISRNFSHISNAAIRGILTSVTSETVLSTEINNNQRPILPVDIYIRISAVYRMAYGRNHTYCIQHMAQTTYLEH